MADWSRPLPPAPCDNLAEDRGLNGSATSSLENSISYIRKEKEIEIEEEEEGEKTPKAAASALFFLGLEGVFTFLKGSLIPFALL